MGESRKPLRLARVVLNMIWDGAIPVPIGKIAATLTVNVGAHNNPIPIQIDYARMTNGSARTSFEGDVFRIVLNEALPQQELRFATAHAIGHVMLKHVCPEFPVIVDAHTLRESRAFDRITWEASQFARALLMPDAYLRHLLYSTLSCTDDIAEKLDVPIDILRRYLNDCEYWPKNRPACLENRSGMAEIQ